MEYMQERHNPYLFFNAFISPVQNTQARDQKYKVERDMTNSKQT